MTHAGFLQELAASAVEGAIVDITTRVPERLGVLLAGARPGGQSAVRRTGGP